MRQKGAAHYTELPEYVSDEFESENIELVVYQLEPGEGINLHYHNPPMEEYYFIMEGKLDVRLGDEEVVAEPGTVVFIPPGVKHQPENNYDETATYMMIVSPPTLTHAKDIEWLEHEHDDQYDRVRSDQRPEDYTE